jgi:hypothetical protein
MHDAWHLDRVVSAIRSAAQDPQKPANADALVAAVARPEGKERVEDRRPKQGKKEAARQREEEAVVAGLEGELRVLRSTDPGMTLLNSSGIRHF